MQQACGVRAGHTASDVLRCAGNSLRDAGAVALSPALRTMSQLTSLNLAGTCRARTTARARTHARTHARAHCNVRASRRLDVAYSAHWGCSKRWHVAGRGIAIINGFAPADVRR